MFSNTEGGVFVLLLVKNMSPAVHVYVQFTVYPISIIVHLAQGDAATILLIYLRTVRSRGTGTGGPA